MKTITVGKTRITITTDGCCDCGGPLDSDAREAGTVGLSVAGIQRSPIQLWRCEKCQLKAADETPRCPVHGTMLPCTLTHVAMDIFKDWRTTFAQLQNTSAGSPRNGGTDG